LLAVADNGRADDACRIDDPTLCNERGVDLGDSARTKATVATALGGVGAALAITGTVLLFTAPDANDASARSHTPALGANSAGLQHSGGF
jgi:hypothetical protein